MQSCITSLKYKPAALHEALIPAMHVGVWESTVYLHCPHAQVEEKLAGWCVFRLATKNFSAVWWQWRHGHRRVTAGIIEHRLSDGASWHGDQADVAIIKKYTSAE